MREQCRHLPLTSSPLLQPSTSSPLCRLPKHHSTLPPPHRYLPQHFPLQLLMHPHPPLIYTHRQQKLLKLKELKKLPLKMSSLTVMWVESVVNIVERSSPSSPQMIGHLNYDIWRHPVGYCVDDLRIKRDFPSRPETRKSIDQLQTTFSAKDKDSLVNKYGHKIYGYLLPATPGILITSA